MTVPTTVSKSYSSLASHPDCTHRIVDAYAVTTTNEPLPFWACRFCGRRFEPMRPRDGFYDDLDGIAVADEASDAGSRK